MQANLATIFLNFLQKFESSPFSEPSEDSTSFEFESKDDDDIGVDDDDDEHENVSDSVNGNDDYHDNYSNVCLKKSCFSQLGIFSSVQYSTVQYSTAVRTTQFVIQF